MNLHAIAVSVPEEVLLFAIGWHRDFPDGRYEIRWQPRDNTFWYRRTGTTNTWNHLLYREDVQYYVTRGKELRQRGTKPKNDTIQIST